MYIVTGAAGFIGSNVVAALNRQGITDIVAVDNVSPDDAPNLSCLQFEDYFTAENLLSRFDDAGFVHKVRAVFHEGACSSTVESDEEFMLTNNYEYSRFLIELCVRHRIVCQYASTAGVYGHNKASRETPDNEAPLTIYGHSKLMIDNYVRSISQDCPSPVTGLRYFNVYGPGEGHKGFMRSTPLVFDCQLRDTGQIKVFGAGEGYEDGQHCRDFIHIDDIVAVKLWLLEHPATGIYNLGTGRRRTFLEVAQTVLNYHGSGTIEFVPFPQKLKGSYQAYTEADLSALRALGYQDEMQPIEQGIPAYLDWLADHASDAAS